MGRPSVHQRPPQHVVVLASGPSAAVSGGQQQQLLVTPTSLATFRCIWLFPAFTGPHIPSARPRLLHSCSLSLLHPPSLSGPCPSCSLVLFPTIVLSWDPHTPACAAVLLVLRCLCLLSFLGVFTLSTWGMHSSLCVSSCSGPFCPVLAHLPWDSRPPPTASSPFWLLSCLPWPSPTLPLLGGTFIMFPLPPMLRVFVGCSAGTVCDAMACVVALWVMGAGPSGRCASGGRWPCLACLTAPSDGGSCEPCVNLRIACTWLSLIGQLLVPVVSHLPPVPDLSFQVCCFCLAFPSSPPLIPTPPPPFSPAFNLRPTGPHASAVMPPVVPLLPPLLVRACAPACMLVSGFPHSPACLLT